jgi:hypothetical protein
LRLTKSIVRALLFFLAVRMAFVLITVTLVAVHLLLSHRAIHSYARTVVSS